MADSIQAKWLQDIKKAKDSVSSTRTKPVTGAGTATAGSLQKPSATKAVKLSNTKPTSTVMPSASSGQVEKKTITAISFDIFKSNPAASLPKIKKSDKPVVRKSPDISPTSPQIPSLPPHQSAPQPSAEGSNKFSYRRSDQADSQKKRGVEDTSDVPKKKRKSVSFKPNDSLLEIRYYVPDSSEMVFFII